MLFRSHESRIKLAPHQGFCEDRGVVARQADVDAGKLVTKDETLCRKEFYTERRLVPLNKAQAFVTTGQGADPTKLLRPLNTAKLKERLARDTRVFFLPDAGKMGPAYARELKAGNVVLVLPRP